MDNAEMSGRGFSNIFLIEMKSMTLIFLIIFNCVSSSDKINIHAQRYAQKTVVSCFTITLYDISVSPYLFSMNKQIQFVTIGPEGLIFIRIKIAPIVKMSN